MNHSTAAAMLQAAPCLGQTRSPALTTASSRRTTLLVCHARAPHPQERRLAATLHETLAPAIASTVLQRPQPPPKLARPSFHTTLRLASTHQSHGQISCSPMLATPWWTGAGRTLPMSQSLVCRVAVSLGLGSLRTIFVSGVGLAAAKKYRTKCFRCVFSSPPPHRRLQ